MTWCTSLQDLLNRNSAFCYKYDLRQFPYDLMLLNSYAIAPSCVLKLIAYINQMHIPFSNYLNRGEEIIFLCYFTLIEWEHSLTFKIRCSPSLIC